MVRRPVVMPAPIHLTRLQSPSIRISPSSASPSIAKNSTSGTCVLPCWIGRARISASDLPERWSGVRHSASTGTVVVPWYFNRSMAVPRGPWGRSTCQQLMKMEMERPQVAAVVTGGNPHHPRPARRPHADAGGFLHRGQVEPVDDDFVDGVDSLGKG